MGVGGSPYQIQKQKLNTKSSTEGEVVGVSDYLPNVIWARMFLEAQGICTTEHIMYQDNQSAIKLEKNGRMSSDQKTKHIDNRYFWIKDRTESENIKIEYCPTEWMLADFFTKPLQGSLFRKFRDVILGYKHISTLTEWSEKVTNKERVGHENKAKKTVTFGNIPSDKTRDISKLVEGEHSSGRTYADAVKKRIEERRVDESVKGLIQLKQSRQ